MTDQTPLEHGFEVGLWTLSILREMIRRQFGHIRFMLHDGTVTAPVLKSFLQRLMVGATNPVFVVVDSHPVHKSTLVRQYIESQGGKLQLFFLSEVVKGARQALDDRSVPVLDGPAITKSSTATCANY